MNCIQFPVYNNYDDIVGGEFKKYLCTLMTMISTCQI
jgi:hypothetical protein